MKTSILCTCLRKNSRRQEPQRFVQGLQGFASRCEKVLEGGEERSGPIRQRGVETKRVPGLGKEIVEKKEKASADIEGLDPWRKSL